MVKTPHDRYLDSLVVDIRHAVIQFRKFDKEWNDLNDALNAKLDAEREFDIVQRDHVKAVNITLRGHMAAAEWWRDKAAMLASVLQAEVAMRK